MRQEREVQNAFNLPSFTDIFRRFQSYRNRFTTPDNAPATGVGQSRWTRFMSWAYDDGERDAPRHHSPFALPEQWAGDLDAFGPMGELHRRQLEKPVHWRPEYTHPERAGPGFAFDFAPADAAPSTPVSPGVIVLDEDAAGPSSAASASSPSVAAVETTLVCARCLDPLVLAAPTSASAEDRKRSRVWALRCGHMLDGKCVAELMLPSLLPPPSPPQLDDPAGEDCLSDKGKGKARAEAPASALDRKGKRKAVEPLQPETSPKRPALDWASEGTALSSMEPLVLEPEENNSIRSRLRSRTRGSGSGSLVPEGAVDPGTVERHRRRGAGASRAAARGKGKARGRAEQRPVIEAEHEWVCPVSGCGRVHVSVRIQGEWRNDEKRGGIALFV